MPRRADDAPSVLRHFGCTMSYIPVICFGFIGRGARRVRRRAPPVIRAKRIRRAVVSAHPSEGCAAARELSEKLQSPLDEVIVELEHPAVPGVGIEDELAAAGRGQRCSWRAPSCRSHRS